VSGFVGYRYIGAQRASDVLMQLNAENAAHLCGLPRWSAIYGIECQNNYVSRPGNGCSPDGVEKPWSTGVV